MSIALLASTVLAVGTALGLATLLFQNVLGYDGLIFSVPFAAAVLLVPSAVTTPSSASATFWDQAASRHYRPATTC